jgi:ATP-binding cassette subfamily F protein 3
MGFGAVARCGDIVLRAERISKAYASTLFHDLTFQIERGQRWAIFGANGSGKTTLLRCLLGLETPDQGQVNLGTGVEVGYFDQRLETVPDDVTALDAVRPAGREMVTKERRDLLARFGLSGDIAEQPVHRLSGGQRNRVALAKLAASQANLLVLDEPTNHLDLWACQRLEESLREFPGTVLLVSHDRFFLNQIVDHMIVLAAGNWRLVHGNYDDFRRMPEPEPEPECDESASDDNRRRISSQPHSGPLRAARPKRRFPFRKVEDLECDIFQLEATIEQLQERLVDPVVLRDGRQVRQLQAEIERHQADLHQLYQHWEEATELN